MQPSPPRHSSRSTRRQPFAVVIALALALAAAMLVWRTGVASSLFGDPGDTPGGGGVAASSAGNGSGSGGGAPSASPTPPAPPTCAYGSKPARSATYAQWRTTLLDTTFRLPAGYVPPDLVPVSQAGFHSNVLVRRLMVRELGALRGAADAAGHPLEIVAAYRSYQYQADLFERRAEHLGEEQARMKTARPGHSEHQLGTAIDFRRAGAETTSQQFGLTATGRWLLANASRYGFVLSYPEGDESVTCYAYEPWHFRYFGEAKAARIVASGLTTREYLWAHRRGKPRGPAGPGPSPSESAPSASP
jgi:D-alanyl-D-alanine carboxypeptidase